MGETVMSIFWLVIMLPCLIIIGVMLTNDAKPKKNIVLGVTLNYAGLHDKRVDAILRRFKRTVWIWCGVSSAAFAAMALLDMGQFIMWSIVLLIVAIIVPYVFYVRANRSLTALKKAEGWSVPHTGGVFVDLRAAANPAKPVKRSAFLPPVVIALVPLVMALCSTDEAERFGGILMSAAIALICLMCMLMYPLILRQRGDVAGPDRDVNAALTRVRRYNWTKMLLATSYLTSIFMLLFYLCMDSELWTLVLTAVYMFVLIGICIATEFTVRRTQERLTRDDPGYIDEDELWLWGMFYNNPNDRHLFINDRTGSGMGVNIGRPAGKVFMALTAALLVGLLVLCIALALGFSSPFEASIADGTLYFSHGAEKYEIALEDITGLDLIAKLPPARRVAGTGLPNLLEGRFTVEGYENVRISLNPEQPPYIVVQTVDITRIFALDSSEETEAFYEELQEAV